MRSLRKNYLVLATICLLLSGLLLGCRKEKMVRISLEVACEIPYSHIPVEGIEVTIKEYENAGVLVGIISGYGDKGVPTGWERKGRIDASGKLTINVEKYNNKKQHFVYKAFFDDANIVSTYSDFYLSEYESSSFSANKTKKIKLAVFPKVKTTFHFKNMNCVDEADELKYEYYNLDVWNSSSAKSENPWMKGREDVHGCADVQTPEEDAVSGRYIFKSEATKGGIKKEVIDTVLIAPGINGNPAGKFNLIFEW